MIGDDELKTKTSIISEKLEEKLNSKGYFDEDIERLDEKDIASKYYEVESDLDSVIYERTKLDYVGEPSYDKGQVRYAFFKKSLIL